MRLWDIVGLLAIVMAIIFLCMRTKREKEPTLFNCARCGGQSIHTERTLAAWRNNKKPYCNECHKRWLDLNAGTPSPKYKNNAGCLGIIVILIIFPCSYFIVQAFHPG